jgi:hypothetical protein
MGNPNSRRRQRPYPFFVNCYEPVYVALDTMRTEVTKRAGKVMNRQQFIPPISPEEEVLRQERRENRAIRRKQQRRVHLSVWASIAMSVLLLLAMGFFFLQVQRTLSIYQPINGISCDSVQHNNYHIHVHITIYINGKPIAIPQNIGIAPDGSCFYWLHTHDATGVIHIEAPQQESGLAVDDFVAVWQGGFSALGFPPQLTVATGWKFFANGKPFISTGNAPLHTEIVFHSHDAITLEYGSPNPPPDMFYAFPANLPT